MMVLRFKQKNELSEIFYYLPFLFAGYHLIVPVTDKMLSLFIILKFLTIFNVYLFRTSGINEASS